MRRPPGRQSLRAPSIDLWHDVDLIGVVEDGTPLGDDGRRFRPGHPELAQDVADALETGLQLRLDDLVGTRLPQEWNATPRRRPGDDDDLRIERAGVENRRPGRHQVGHRHGEDARLHDPGAQQESVRARVAVEGLNALGAKVPHGRRVDFDHRVADTSPGEGVAEHGANPAIAAEDDVVGNGFDLRLRSGLGGFLGADAGQVIGQGNEGWTQLLQEGRDQDRAKGDCQDQPVLFAADNPVRQGYAGQHEAELTHLGHQEGGQGRCPVIDAGGQERAADDQHLTHDQGCHQAEDEQGVGRDVGGVEEHPHGDEEERREDIPQRDDFGQHLTIELGFGDDEPGQEGAERQGESRFLAGVGSTQGDQDDGQQEKLTRFRPGHCIKDARHQPDTEDKNRRQRDCGDAQRLQEREREVAITASEDRQEGDHRHQAEVLHDAEAERGPALGARRFTAAHQQLDGDDRATDSEAAAEQDRGLPGPADGKPGHGPQNDGERDLETTPKGGGTAHVQQLGERELDPNREHQEGDPEVGKGLDAGPVGNETGRIRPDQHPGQDIAEQHRLSQPLGDHPAEESRPQRQDKIEDQMNIGQLRSLNASIFAGKVASWLGVRW